MLSIRTSLIECRQDVGAVVFAESARFQSIFHISQYRNLEYSTPPQIPKKELMKANGLTDIRPPDPQSP